MGSMLKWIVREGISQGRWEPEGGGEEAGVREGEWGGGAREESGMVGWQCIGIMDILVDGSEWEGRRAEGENGVKGSDSK